MEQTWKVLRVDFHVEDDGGDDGDDDQHDPKQDRANYNGFIVILASTK